MKKIIAFLVSVAEELDKQGARQKANEIDMALEKLAKKKNKYTKKEVSEVHDLAERMMGGGHVPKEIDNPYALSFWMKGKGYEVKEKPSKPHARVAPFKPKKKKDRKKGKKGKK